MFRYLVPSIARTKSLIIQSEHTRVHAASLLLRSPSPALQNLEVYVYLGLVRLPDDFLGRQAPLLRSLTFNGVSFESHFPLPNLIEFNLSRIPVGAISAPPTNLVTASLQDAKSQPPPCHEPQYRHPPSPVCVMPKSNGKQPTPTII